MKNKNNLTKTINMLDFGKKLTTRENGIDSNSLISKTLLDYNHVILDFEGIELLTSSFADEIIGKNVLKLGIDNFKRKVKIKNASSPIKTVIKKAICDRI